MAATDYRMFLATNVVNEKRMVTYRSLSRALKIHSIRAKQMLYDFHHRETARKTGSVHATYIITGTPQQVEPVLTNGHHVEDQKDKPMQSSPPMSSSMPQQETVEEAIPTKSIILVREEELEAVKASLQDITSIHIYSLEPAPIEDLHILTDVARDMRQKYYASEDPLEYGKGYGVIQNKNVKRRTGRRPPSAPAPVPAPAKEAKPAKKTEDPKPGKASATSSQSSSKGQRRDSDAKQQPQPEKATPPEPKAGPKQPTLKRDKSDIFKSFAKAKPKLKKEDTDSSAVVSAPEEPALKSDSEGVEEEEDDDAMFLDTGTTKTKKRSSGGPSRKEREAKLRKMMDEADEDEDMPDAAETPAAEPEQETANKEKIPDRTEDFEIVQEEKPKAKQHESLGTIPGGRRRGRRQVMKKKMLKDDEGYLVTREEPVWESFSEDEPEPMKPKAKPSAMPVASSKGTKGGKGSGGNIMSFFAKKQ